MDAGQIAKLDPYHLIFSIWALTQHYSDFEAQIKLVRAGNITDPYDGAQSFVETIFDKILSP
jgi:TetR/AcrR family transcriptional regulator